MLRSLTVLVCFLRLSLARGTDLLAHLPWTVHFSPGGGCTAAIVDALGSARSTVLVQAYSFTSMPIAKALVDAHRRGVNVEVVLDRSQRTEQYSSATFIANAGIPEVAPKRRTENRASMHDEALERIHG